MKALIKILEKTTGREVKSKNVTDQIQAIKLLEAMPDQSNELNAKYVYTAHLIHHANIISEPIAEPVYTTVLHEIDLSNPFYQKHPFGASRILLDQDGNPAGSATIVNYNYITDTYLVDVSFQGSINKDRIDGITADRLVTQIDIINRGLEL